MDIKDYYKKNEIKKCDVCGRIVLVDQFGNGECENCGWVQNENEYEFEKVNKISYPNLVPLSEAKEQYNQGRKFKASFENFLNGLFFYGEMLFKYKGELFEVDLLGDRKNKYKIVYGCNRFKQEFYSKNDFASRSTLDGRLLKDMWDEVEWSGFMHCD
ncbi:MAG: hypothetical protein J6J23_02170 [Clostridia bacterium]|nr:hypothetical protein [Clostridia bacterium]